MTKAIYVALCLVPTIIGTIVGWNIGEKIGIAALPPNAWAGDGMGILDSSIRGSSRGAVIGFGVGLACCFLLYFLARRSRSPRTLPLTLPDDSVWPPPPAV